MKKILVFVFAIVAFVFCNGQTEPPALPGTDTLYLTKKDKLWFEIVFDENGHAAVTQVKKMTDTAKTISITLNYNGAMGTMLEITNPFSKKLFYKAELYAPRKKEYVETSTMPVYPQISSYETWPFKIDKMRLTGFILKDGD